MAQDQWFVINGVHHQGPFQMSKLKQMAMENDFSKDHRFWRPGMKESITRSDFFTDFLGIGLPELPKKKQVKEISISSAEEIDFDLNDFLNSDVSDISKEEELTNPKFSEAPDIDDNPMAQFKYQKSKKHKKKNIFITFKYLLAICALAIISVGGFYTYNFFQPKLARPEGIRVDDFNRAMKCYQKKGSQCFSLVISKDYSNLWVVTNKEVAGTVYIKLTSGSSKNFSLKNISLSSTAVMKDRNSYHRLLEFDEGVNLVPGTYSLSVRISDKPVYTQKEFYLGHIDEVTFNKQLKEIRSNLVNKRIRPWRELEEKYQTLSALLISIRSELKSALFEARFKSWDERSDFFDEAYRTKFGHMFTAFVLSNDDSKDDEEKKAQVYKKEVMTYYGELETLAKSLGKITVESVSELKKMKKLSEKELTKQKQMILKKFEELQTVVVNKKRLISAKVLSLKEL